MKYDELNRTVEKLRRFAVLLSGFYEPGGREAVTRECHMRGYRGLTFELDLDGVFNEYAENAENNEDTEAEPVDSAE